MVVPSGGAPALVLAVSSAFDDSSHADVRLHVRVCAPSAPPARTLDPLDRMSQRLHASASAFPRVRVAWHGMRVRLGGSACAVWQIWPLRGQTESVGGGSLANNRRSLILLVSGPEPQALLYGK
jgi:hypothetical protein